ncbi:unnamed protein product, partial [Symbiodinium sp. KB8]
VRRINDAAATAIAGLIDVDLDPAHRETIAHGLVGLAEGASRRLVGSGERFDPDEIARVVSQLAWVVNPLKATRRGADAISVKMFRTALIATALAVVATPSTVAAGAEDDAVRELADAAAELVAEEQTLVATAATDPTASTARLRVVDGTGSMVLEQFDELGVQLTAASRAVLSPLPAQGQGFAPPSQVYDAALDDLMRISATPAAALPTESGSNGPALGLLAVAAMSLLVLGAAALANSLRR